MANFVDVGMNAILGNKGAEAYKYVTIIAEQAGLDIVITLDCTMNITVQKNSTVSKHKVQKSRDVGDHIEVQATSVNVQGYVTDASISLLDRSFSSLAAIGAEQIPGLAPFSGIVSDAVGFLAGENFDPETGRPLTKSQEAYDLFDALREARSLVTIGTERETFVEMAITSLNFPRTQTTGKSMHVNFTATRLPLVGLETTEVLIAEDRAGGKQNQDLRDQGRSATGRDSSVAFEFKEQATELFNDFKDQILGGK